MLRISNPLNAKSWIAPQILLRAFLLDRYKDPTYGKKKPMESSHRQAPGCLSLVTLLDTSIPVVMNVPRRLIERLGAATMTHAQWFDELFQPTRLGAIRQDTGNVPPHA
jgi:hypothetical protein